MATIRRAHAARSAARRAHRSQPAPDRRSLCSRRSSSPSSSPRRSRRRWAACTPKLDYTAFVSIGTVGLLVPLTTIFAGLSVIVDRDSGAQRELLAAPIPRALLVLGNLAVALALSALQIAVLVGVAALRGADFHVSATGIAWFAVAALRLRGLHVRRGRDARQPHPQSGGVHRRHARVAILPWFFAGALFPISALPGALTAFAKVLPLTHAMALMRYGLVDPRGTGLHDIWGMSNTDHRSVAQLGRRRALRRRAHRAVGARVHARRPALTLPWRQPALPGPRAGTLPVEMSLSGLLRAVMGTAARRPLVVGLAVGLLAVAGGASRCA